MGTSACRVALLLLIGSILGCSTPNPNVRVRRLPDGRLQVDGPLAGPFKTQEELATKACTLMTSQPGASTGKVGFEYCALHYYAVEDDAYFLSYLSDIHGDLPNGLKYCTVPRSLNELNEKTTIVLGPAHTHSINRELSRIDMGAQRQPGETPVGSSQLFDKATGRIWMRELLMFYREWNGACSAYRYNYSTRVVSALRDGAWVPIGKAEGNWGYFKSLEGKGWLP